MNPINLSLKAVRHSGVASPEVKFGRANPAPAPHTADYGQSVKDWKKQFTGGKDDQLNAALLFAGPV